MEAVCSLSLTLFGTGMKPHGVDDRPRDWESEKLC